ncbi:hypothetical protein ACFYYR_24865 [Streptomyces sp. NPDC001922]|uniref:hypothetical protein n=1 Tax=Streptomyces sp. NPDC001922 TaxID=3364624 RepID=UPI0036B5EBC0
MRTSLKMSVMAVAAIAAIGASATSAVAYDKKKDDDKQINVCGNSDATAFAAHDAYLYDIEQEAEGPVFCQNGKNNTAVNYAPKSYLLYIGGLL